MEDLPTRLSTAIEEGDAKRTADLLDIRAPMDFETFAEAAREKQYGILQLFLDHGWGINTESAFDRKIFSALPNMK